MKLGYLILLSVALIGMVSCEAPAPTPTPSASAPPPTPIPAPTPLPTPKSAPTPTIPTSEHQQEEVYYLLVGTNEPEKYILPTFEELEREKGGLARNYPGTVKGVHEPSPDYANRLIRKWLPELEDSGLNTFQVLPHYFYENNEFVLRSVVTSMDCLMGEKAERDYIDQVVKAKKAGFAVHLMPICSPAPEVAPDPDAINEFALREARKWAQVAEEYQVEYFSPFGEYERAIARQGLSEAVAVERVNSWNQKVLAEVRPVFKGKIILKVGAKFLDSDPAQFASGYDMLTVTTTGFPSAARFEEDLNRFPERIRGIFDKAQEVAERDNVEWMAHFFISTEGRPEEQSVEIFSIVFEEYTKTLREEQKPVGFTFTGWEASARRMKDTEVVPFLKQFFHDIDSAEFDGTE